MEPRKKKMKAREKELFTKGMVFIFMIIIGVGNIDDIKSLFFLILGAFIVGHCVALLLSFILAWRLNDD